MRLSQDGGGEARRSYTLIGSGDGDHDAGMTQASSFPSNWVRVSSLHSGKVEPERQILHLGFDVATQSTSTDRTGQNYGTTNTKIVLMTGMS